MGVEEEEKMNEQEEDEEEILTLGDSNPEEAIAPSEGLNIGLDAEEDTDPGYEIVTEDRGTNCPSLSGSLRKIKSECKAAEDDIKEVEEETLAAGLPPAAPKRQKRWSKLMKYTLPSKTPETKVKKENKERKSLKDKMKENDFVVFLTERRAVSESRFRVLDKIGSPGKLTRTKSDQSVDESWNTGITTGSIRGLKSRFESEDEELGFDLQTPADDTTGEATILDEEQGKQVAEAIEEAVTGLDNEKNKEDCEEMALEKISGSNDSTPDSGNDEKKTKLERK